MFQVIPAADLLDGKVVRLFRGDYARVTVYGDDPSDPIREFIDQGAELIHIVDLNAARSGERDVNQGALEKIVAAANGRARLELGGGVRDLASLARCFELGFERAIIGTAAVNDPAFLAEALARHGGERIIVGVDARDGRVRVAGWEQDSGRPVTDFLRELENAGIREVIFTDIMTDGALTGPAVDSLREVIGATRAMRVVASGGIASLDDIRALLDLNEPRLVGAITGRAVYEKKLDVRAAVELCRARE